jgi:putative heme-binding domain-containing protein
MQKWNLTSPDVDKDTLGRDVLGAVAKLSKAEQPQRVFLGRQVFERAGCTKCHTTVTENTPLAPTLKGIATAQKADYLVESVIYPSKVIKTGYETEQILTKGGKVLTGLVKDEGQFLRILTADSDTRVAKADVEERSVQKVSLMPEGQEKLLSRGEFVDLIAYLLSLK